MVSDDIAGRPDVDRVEALGDACLDEAGQRADDIQGQRAWPSSTMLKIEISAPANEADDDIILASTKELRHFGPNMREPLQDLDLPLHVAERGGAVGLADRKFALELDEFDPGPSALPRQVLDRSGTCKVLAYGLVGATSRHPLAHTHLDVKFIDFC